MGNNELVSVIMPAFNAEFYIYEAIDSVIAQTYNNWELIIVDDGSTDATAKVVKGWMLKDKRIHYYYQVNGKQGKARNLGISKSQGVYLAFLDADDLWLPEKLWIQLQEIIEKNVDLVFSDCYVFSETNVRDKTKTMNTVHAYFSGVEGLKLFMQSNRIPILTALVKKEKVDLVGGFSEKILVQNAEDYHLWLKMIINDCVFYGSDNILASYRVHEMASTSQDKIASKQIPEVFFDLMQNNPKVGQIILKAIKTELRKQNNQTIYIKSDFYNVINENCRYLNRQSFAPYYNFINYFLGPKITKKFLNYLMND